MTSLPVVRPIGRPRFRPTSQQGTRLPCETVAGDYHRGVISDVAQSRPAGIWLGSSELAAGGAKIVEHATVIPEPGWGGVLSLLWIPGSISAAA